MKKIIILIVIIIITLGGITYTLQKSYNSYKNSDFQANSISGSKKDFIKFITQIFKSKKEKCGDGICGAKEKVDPKLCPQDCKMADAPTAPADCPQLAPPAPNWCSGGTIIAGKIDEKGCQSSPTCVAGNTLSPSLGISPFGIMAAFDESTLSTINVSDKIAWVGEQIGKLGAKWSRGAPNIFWAQVEPVIGQGYDFSKSDDLLKEIYENTSDGFNQIVILSSSRAKNSSSDISSASETQFKNFVKAVVERYDGDGVGDYDPNIKVKYWQADNEPFPRHWEKAGGTIDGYVRFLELLSAAAREADSGAKIILGTFQFETSDHIAKLNEVIPKMKGKNLFDYADTHFWNYGNNYKIPLTEAKKIFDANGYSSIGYMSLEFGSWLSDRGSKTEKEHANYAIKGFVYNIANGFSVINWNNLVEWKDYGGNPKSIYNYMGLIADGLNGDPVPAGTFRLAYHSYKKMTETLEGSDWNNIQKVQEVNGVYIYKFTKNNKPVWVAWNDNATAQTITLDVGKLNSIKTTEAVPKYESGKEVADYAAAFNVATKTANSGKISITLGDKPVFVE